jgi:stage V sporulation protein AD
MPRTGAQTWLFPSHPRIISRATVAGKTESEGPLGHLFDRLHSDDRMNMDTWEHAEQHLFEMAARMTLDKANVGSDSIDLIVGGDLNAQLTGFYFGLQNFNAPKLGVFSACSSFTEAVALSALALESQVATLVLAGTSSHNSTAERQFRYPTEYGAQKPPTAQRTVTGAGMALIGYGHSPIVISSATIGRVIDYGVSNPWEMGAAMAPAALSTIMQHLTDTGRTINDFDCIATGDLGTIGHNILRDLLMSEGIDAGERLTDCGMLIFDSKQQEVFSGGSGAACSTLVTLSYLLNKLESGEWRRILVSATGALLSAVSTQQGDTIPSVSHAVVFERKD